MKSLAVRSLLCLEIYFVFYIFQLEGKGYENGDFNGPYFSEPILNVTVAAGRTANLRCVVENLQNYRVAWIHTDRYTLLTLQNRVISRSPRYKVSHDGHKTWYLHIENVQAKDRGDYMCQINTSPMRSQIGRLDIVVPPHISDNFTSSDTEVREGSTAVIKCNAHGSPTPEITWRREDGAKFSIGKQKFQSYKWKQLNFTQVSRLHMGAYLCIASNNVPPSVSKRIMLNVKFPPMIWIPNQLVGVSIPSNDPVDLQCHLESHPPSVTYWTRDPGIILVSSEKYDSILMPTNVYKTQMILRIRNLEPKDLGSYSCIAKSPLGETAGTIRLYEVPSPSTSTAFLHHEELADVSPRGFSRSRNEKKAGMIYQTGHRNAEEIVTLPPIVQKVMLPVTSPTPSFCRSNYFPSFSSESLSSSSKLLNRASYFQDYDEDNC